jgi:hypothetical protein
MRIAGICRCLDAVVPGHKGVAPNGPGRRRKKQPGFAREFTPEVRVRIMGGQTGTVETL